MLLEIYFEPQGINQCLVYLNDLRVSGAKCQARRQPYLFQLDVPHSYLENLKGIMIQNNIEHEYLKVSFLAQSNSNSPLTLIGSKAVTYRNLKNRPSSPNDGLIASLGLCKVKTGRDIPSFVFLNLEYYEEDEILKQSVEQDRYSFLSEVETTEEENIQTAHLLSQILLNNVKSSSVDAKMLEINLVQFIEKGNKIYEHLYDTINTILSLLKEKENIDYSRIKNAFFESFLIDEEKIQSSCSLFKGWANGQCFNLIGGFGGQYMVLGNKFYLVPHKGEDNIIKLLKLERKIAKQLIKPNKSISPLMKNLRELQRVIGLISKG